MTKKDRAAGWLMTLLGGLWLGLFPLWQDGSYTRITHAKWLGMLILSGITAAAVLGLAVMLLRRGQIRKLRLHPAQLLALGYLVWVLLSACFGSMADSRNDGGQLAVWMGAKRYEGALTQCCYVAVFLLMSLYPAQLRPVMNAAAGGMLIYAAIVALQYAGLNPFGLFPLALNVRTNYEFQGPIGNIDMVSGYACLVTPALLFSYAAERTGLLCLLAGTVGTLLLLMIEVQSGLIALAAAMGLLALLMLRRPGTRRRGCLALACVLAMLSLRLLIGLPWLDRTEQIVFFHAFSLWKLIPLVATVPLAMLSRRMARRPGRPLPWRWLIALIALAAVLATVALMLLPFPEGSGLWELREVLQGRARDSFGSERLGVWRLTLEIAREHPIFGTGPDTFWYALPQHMNQTEQNVLWQKFDNPHNLLLQVLSGSGVPALLMYLALMGCAARLCLRASRRDPWPLALLAGLAAYLLQGMFTFSICLVSPMFWAMLGMAVAQSCRQEGTIYDE